MGTLAPDVGSVSDGCRMVYTRSIRYIHRVVRSHSQASYMAIYGCRMPGCGSALLYPGNTYRRPSATCPGTDWRTFHPKIGHQKLKIKMGGGGGRYGGRCGRRCSMEIR